MSKSKSRGKYTRLVETRVSPEEWAQLDIIAQRLDTTRAQLLRFGIESLVWRTYGTQDTEAV